MIPNVKKKLDAEITFFEKTVKKGKDMYIKACDEFDSKEKLVPFEEKTPSKQ